MREFTLKVHSYLFRPADIIQTLDVIAWTNKWRIILFVTENLLRKISSAHCIRVDYDGRINLSYKGCQVYFVTSTLF